LIQLAPCLEVAYIRAFKRIGAWYVGTWLSAAGNWALQGPRRPRRLWVGYPILYSI